MTGFSPEICPPSEQCHQLKQVSVHAERVEAHLMPFDTLRASGVCSSRFLDVETVLTTILKQIRRIVHHDSAGIFLHEGDALVHFAGFIGNTIDNCFQGQEIPFH